MKKNIYISSLFIIALLAVTSCLEEVTPPETDLPLKDQIVFRNEISPETHGIIANDDALPPYATKSLIDNATTQLIPAQFLRLDEKVVNNKGQYIYDNWNLGYLVDATVVSSPSNEKDGYRRSITLTPAQTYKIYATKNGTEKMDTTFYHTRLVCWHPQIFDLKNPDNTHQVTQLEYFNGKGMYELDETTGKVSLIFKNLDGRKDVMVSDVREGQHWHHDNRKPGIINGIEIDVNNPNPVESDLHEGKNVYREPFGFNKAKPSYDNSFKFQHFLSAIKVFGYTESKTVEQNTTMWGKIKDVVVRDQPKSLKVTIPEFNENSSSIPVFESSFDYSEKVDFNLSKDPIFGSDGNNNPSDNKPADKEPTLENTSKSHPAYLGNALIAPNQDVILDIHTESGVFSVTIPHLQDQKPANPNGKAAVDPAPEPAPKDDVFDAGYIYNIYLNFSTTGTIAAILLKDSGGTYLDLTTGDVFKLPDAPEDEHHIEYYTANCYIVDPSATYTAKVEKPGTQGPVEEQIRYDGFTFLANKIGNGESGILGEFPNQDPNIKPATASLIWESSQGLITDVEYMYNYIRFKVPSATALGNAVIGAFSEDNKILWSWHIWITTEKPQTMTFPLTPGSSINLTFMDRNLGALSADPTADPLKTYGLYYQWGRKDPSMYPKTKDYRPLSSETSSYFDFYGNELTSTEIVSKDKPTVLDGINNPMYLIMPTSIPPYYNYDWIYRRINTLWGTDEGTLKTIYDPCPAGYKMPGEELSSFLLNYYMADADNANITVTKDRGKHSYLYTIDGKNVYFPLGGYKGVDRGMASLTANWKYVGLKGDYMSKTLNPNGHRMRTYLSLDVPWIETGADADGDGFGDKNFKYQDYITTDYTNRRTAASVRCISDEFKEYVGRILAKLEVPSILLLNDVLSKDGLSTAYNLNYNVYAPGNGIWLDHLEITEELPAGVSSDFTLSKKYTGKEQTDGTRNESGEAKPITITHKASNKYDLMGNFKYNLYVQNNKNLSHIVSKTTSIINFDDIYDIRFDGVPFNARMPYPDGNNPEKQPNQWWNNELVMSFKIHTRGQDQESPMEDLKNLYSNTRTYVNGKLVGATLDKDGTFKVKAPVLLEDEIKLTCVTNDGRALKEYVLVASYDDPDRIKKIENNMVLAISGYSAGTEYNKYGKNNFMYYYRTGNKMAYHTPRYNMIHSNNLFSYNNNKLSVYGEENYFTQEDNMQFTTNPGNSGTFTFEINRNGGSFYIYSTRISKKYIGYYDGEVNTNNGSYLEWVRQYNPPLFYVHQVLPETKHYRLVEIKPGTEEVIKELQFPNPNPNTQ